MSAADRLHHVVVAIPARDEQSLLPACLRSVTVAASVLRRARPGIRLAVAVALDGCTDGSAQVVSAWGVPSVTLPGAGVGAARDAAMALGTRRLLALGATPLPARSGLVTLADPDGGEFTLSKG